jgi:hypothetical protein
MPCVIDAAAALTHLRACSRLKLSLSRSGLSACVCACPHALLQVYNNTVKNLLASETEVSTEVPVPCLRAVCRVCQWLHACIIIVSTTKLGVVT